MYSIIRSAVALALCALASASYHRVVGTHTGAHSEYVGQVFGMASGGKITVDYTVETDEFPSQTFAFVVSLAQSENWYSLWYDASDTWVSYLCNFPSMARWELSGSGNVTWIVDSADRYRVFLAHCSESNTVYWDMEVNMLNPDPNGEVSQHLSIDQVNFPQIYAALLLCYLLPCIALSAELFASTERHKLAYYAIYATGMSRVVEMVALTVQYHAMNDHGHISTSFVVFVQIMEHLRLTILLFMLLLVCMGWNFTRQLVYPKEIGFLLAIMGLYLLLGSLAVPCEMNMEVGSCAATLLGLYALHFIIILAIIVAVNFTFTQLRAILNDVAWTPDISVQYLRMKQYQALRGVFFSYLLSPLVVYVIQVTMLSWKDTWILEIINQLIEYGLFLHVASTFRPLKSSFLTRAFDNSLNVQAR